MTQAIPDSEDLTLAADPLARDRDLAMAEMPLAPDSLRGSYFRAPDQDDAEAEAAWLDGTPTEVIEGMVVAEVFATSSTMIYLVEFYGRNGGTGYQRLVEVERMLVQRWAFYDTDGWLASGRERAEQAIRREHAKTVSKSSSEKEVETA